MWIALGCTMAVGQQDSVPAAASASSTAPVIGFTLDFPASDPTYYQISISPDGRGSYSSKYRAENTGQASEQTSDRDGANSDGTDHDATESYGTKFVATGATTSQMFELAKQAHYFEGKVDSANKHLAFTGAKTIRYEAQGKITQASYNYSSVPAVQQLTAIFQDMSGCLEFGRRLEHNLRFQKLALEDELKNLEQEIDEGHLKQVFVIAPMLQKIADDPAAMNVARGRAQKILAKAGAGR
jgi:hypothetical protein